MSSSSPTTTISALFVNVIPIIAVYSYFAGWMHLYFFYDALGVSLLAIDLPFHFFLVYAFTIFPSFWMLLSLFAVTSLTFLYYYWSVQNESAGQEIYRHHKFRNAFDRLSRNSYCLIGLAFILAMVTFAGIAELSRNAALAKADNVRRGGALHHIDLFLKADAKSKYPKKLVQNLTNGSLTKLLQTKDRIYILLQPSQDNNILGSASTFSIALSDVSAIDVKIDKALLYDPNSVK